jgi:hypothetical protein
VFHGCRDQWFCGGLCLVACVPVRMPWAGATLGFDSPKVLLHLVETSSPNVSIPVRTSRRLAGSGNRVMSMGSPTRQERPSCSARGATAGAQKSGRVGPALEAASAVGVDRADDGDGPVQRGGTVTSAGRRDGGGRDYHSTRRGGHEPRSVAWALVFSADEGVLIG